MNNTKKNAVFRLLMVLGGFIALNIIGYSLRARLDLTQEKRFSISQTSKNILSKLKETVYIKVYLEGDFPSDFKKLHNAAEDILAEMRSQSNGNLQYEFINPSESTDTKATDEVFKQLMKKGLQPSDLQIKQESGLKRQIIFPGAMIYYGEKEIPVNFLQGTSNGGNTQMVINASEENLEYALMKGIKSCMGEKPKIGVMEGVKTLNRRQIFDAATTLSETYTMQPYNLSSIAAIPNDFKAIIVAKPDTAFTEWQKFKIDNYLMQGGSVLWCIDPVIADMDSMKAAGFFMSVPAELNLDDLFFKYGIRINANLVQDLRCGQIPVVYGMMGGKPQQDLFPWAYFPIVAAPQGGATNPISKNIDPVYLQFSSSIDTVGRSKVKKTVLLASSQYTKLLLPPTRINLMLATQKPEPSQYNAQPQAIAVLLEGSFESLYKNRGMNIFANQAIDSLQMKRVDVSVPTKQIFIADGDVIKNFVSKTNQENYYPLGYDRFTKQLYGNKAFISNCIDYLADSENLIEIRNKEITLRLLNKESIKAQKTLWQLLNIVLPIVLTIAFGLGYNWWRRRKYAR